MKRPTHCPTCKLCFLAAVNVTVLAMTSGFVGTAGAAGLSGTQLSTDHKMQESDGLATSRNLSSLANSGSAPQCLDFPTRSHDNQRTGLADCETKLTLKNVNVNNFGKIGSMLIDGATYAAPLFLANLNVNGGIRNVVLICTLRNSVYLFDVDHPTKEIWHVNLGRAVPPSGFPGPSDVGTDIGILSTPTIDRASNTAWVVSASPAGSGVNYSLHALDLLTGGPKVTARIISGSVRGTASDAMRGRVVFKGSNQLQRPGLLYQNGLVHIGFGSHTDRQPYHGWMFSYDGTTLQRTGVVLTSVHSQGAAIWQAGAGLAGSGNDVFFVTGNGFTGKASTGKGVVCNAKLPDDRCESLVRVAVNKKGSNIADWFTPTDWSTLLDAQDLDLGISGPMLIPGTGQAIIGGKTGILYNVPYNNMGHITAKVTDKVTVGTGDSVRGATALWQGPQGTKVFVSPRSGKLKAFSFDGLHIGHTPDYESQDGVHGSFITVSSNKASPHTGIVWSSSNNAMGSLLAYDASNLHLLYSSEQNPNRDHSGAFVKFLPPTIADGRVLLGGVGNRVDIYGLLAVSG